MWSRDGYGRTAFSLSEIALPHLVLYFIETTNIAGEDEYSFR